MFSNFLFFCVPCVLENVNYFFAQNVKCFLNTISTYKRQYDSMLTSMHSKATRCSDAIVHCSDKATSVLRHSVKELNMGIAGT